MGGEICELCGYINQPGATVIHRIVPKEVTEPAGIPESATVVLCPKCQQEIRSWYSRKVFNMTYDDAAKQFRAKSYPEMVKEYQSAFNSFVKYKKEQKKPN